MVILAEKAHVAGPWDAQSSEHKTFCDPDRSKGLTKPFVLPFPTARLCAANVGLGFDLSAPLTPIEKPSVAQSCTKNEEVAVAA
jgi:hypothetical protein